MSKELDRQLLVEAMERLARTPDGRVLYMHLQTVLLAVEPLGNAPDAAGALRENLGRRLLARDIRNLMAPGVREIDPSVDERPTVIRPAEPVRLAPKFPGARRRVDPTITGTGPEPAAE